MRADPWSAPHQLDVDAASSMASALFPKKRTFVTYGRRSGKAAPVISSLASRPAAAGKSSREDIEDEPAHGLPASSNDDDNDNDELPEISSLRKPSFAGVKATPVPEVLVTGSPKRPSEKALGKRRMEEEKDTHSNDSDDAVEVRASIASIGPTSKARSPKTTKTPADTSGHQAKLLESRAKSAPKRRKTADSDAQSERASPDAGQRPSKQRRSRTPSDNAIPVTKPASHSSSPAKIVASSPSKAPRSPQRRLSPPLASPKRTERASVSPLSSPPDLPIDLPPEPLGFGFDDLLDGSSASLYLATKPPRVKRSALIRQMSARSDADSDTGGSCESPPCLMMPSPTKTRQRSSPRLIGLALDRKATSAAKVRQTGKIRLYAARKHRYRLQVSETAALF